MGKPQPFLSTDELRKLREDAGRIRKYDRSKKLEAAVEVVFRYLVRPMQAKGRSEDFPQNTEDVNIASMRIDIVLGAVDGSEVQERSLKRLLKAASARSSIYALVRAPVAELLRRGCRSETLLNFIASDYGGELKPKDITRMATPKDKRRTFQAHLAVRALMEVGISENAALKAVTEGSRRAGVVYPKAYSGQPVTFSHVRNAHRKHKAQWDRLLGGVTDG